MEVGDIFGENEMFIAFYKGLPVYDPDDGLFFDTLKEATDMVENPK